MTGLDFTNRLSADRYLTNQIYLNGSGAAAGDVDGDGKCDVYICGLDGPNALYRNLGNWKFENISVASEVECAGLEATGAALADLDGDGDLDLVVNSVAGGTHIFLNDGKARFAQISPSSPLNPRRGAMSMALADIEGDGDLDLYVANYRTDTIRDRPQTRIQGTRINGKLVVLGADGRSASEPDLEGRYTLSDSGQITEHGEADVLFRNDGAGRFTPLSFTNGVFLDTEGRALREPPYDWGLSVMFRDLNADGAPDIYVCNDFPSEDRIWMNSGQGSFRLIPRLALRKTSLFSMGVDFADLNHDGADEIFVADMLSRVHARRHLQAGSFAPPVLAVGTIDDRPQYSHNTLFLNRRDGTYAEIAYYSAVQASEWSWAPIFLDVDLDGHEDLLISTGHELEIINADVSERTRAMKAQRKMSIPEQLALRRMYPRLDTPNVAFRNRDGLRFEDVSGKWGFDQRGVSHGMCLADLDGDGDLDVLINNLNEEAGIYRNNGVAARVAVRLKGLASNTRGIGARIKVSGGAVPVQSQEMICGGRYLSGDDAVRVFAAGNPTNEMRIEVTWRSGRKSVVHRVKANRIYEIDESAAESINPQPSTLNPAKPLFEDVSGLLNHRHHEEAFDDFDRQPALPNRLSQLGPGLSWWDVDDDGWEDLIIGSGRGGKPVAYRNDGKGGFAALTGAPWDGPVTRDQAGVLGWGRGILVGSSNYEDGLTNGSCIRIHDAQRRSIEDIMPGQPFSVGPLAMGDIDADGDLDLFIGGRVIPGRYPEPPTSLVCRNDDGRLVIGQRLEKLGLVSGAVLSDLDGDGWPELALACEWGPIRIFRNERGNFVPWETPVSVNDRRSTLNRLTGEWNGITTGDFDGDGRLDIVASNRGLNSAYRLSLEYGRKMYYGDWDTNGTVEIVEAYYDEGLAADVPLRSLRALGAALPWVQEKYESHAAYGKASLSEVVGEKLRSAGVVEVRALGSMVFLNRRGGFQARTLPLEAQLAPGFAVCTGDYDGDGNEDIFLSQNFFATNPDQPRQDAGRGLWLQGDGRGGFKAVPGQESGVRVYGEQRGAALCDYDADGRVDLAVTQNGAETKLYRNVGAKAGLRVRLKGPEGNPRGLGARLRLVAGERRGPVREVHGGSGYWSQDAAVQVMGMVESPTQIEVQWPGGKTTKTPIPAGAKEIVLDTAGTARSL
ncbi:MAG TPA: FG-GAP-like repeat-containing protein [Verrucomicrobiae bacterium]|nr:FG-GAP-like repeat-containing protein [Verrucomicrobiae bacterium]